MRERGQPCQKVSYWHGGAAVTLHPDFANAVWTAKACAPQVRDGKRLAAIHEALERRAVGLGYFYTASQGAVVTA